MRVNFGKPMAVLAVGALLAAAGTAVAAASARTDSSSNFTAADSVRIMDTRTGTGVAKAAVTRAGTVSLQVAGVDGVPADATAVVLDAGVTAAQTSGYETVYPDSAARVNTSAVDFAAGQSVMNTVTVKLVDGKVDFYNGSGGTVQLFADLEGWYSAAPAAYQPTTVDGTLVPADQAVTGGSFVSNSTQIGTLDLKAGTYQLSFKYKVSPDATFAAAHPSVQVFPLMAVYTQPKNADFTGDEFNTSTSLETGGLARIDSYLNGSTVVTLDSDTTLDFYLHGYDSDSGAGVVDGDGGTVTAVSLN